MYSKNNILSNPSKRAYPSLQYIYLDNISLCSSIWLHVYAYMYIPLRRWIERTYQSIIYLIQPQIYYITIQVRICYHLNQENTARFKIWYIPSWINPSLQIPVLYLNLVRIRANFVSVSVSIATLLWKSCLTSIIPTTTKLLLLYIFCLVTQTQLKT